MSGEQTAPRRRGRPGGMDAATLLGVARELFLRAGYAATTMDAVAAAGRVSKQTLYRRHASKEALFAAVVTDWVDRGRDAMRPHLDRLLEADDVRRGLLDLAAVLQEGVLSAPVVHMRGLVIAEAERLPEVAADYVRRSWDHHQRELADALGALADRGLLRIDDPEVAAQQLTWLVLGPPLDRLTLTAGTDRLPARRLQAMAESGVDTFLARFDARASRVEPVSRGERQRTSGRTSSRGA